jgi:hypothetical protein
VLDPDYSEVGHGCATSLSNGKIDPLDLSSLPDIRARPSNFREDDIFAPLKRFQFRHGAGK